MDCERAFTTVLKSRTLIFTRYLEILEIPRCVEINCSDPVGFLQQ